MAFHRASPGGQQLSRPRGNAMAAARRAQRGRGTVEKERGKTSNRRGERSKPFSFSPRLSLRTIFHAARHVWPTHATPEIKGAAVATLLLTVDIPLHGSATGGEKEPLYFFHPVLCLERNENRRTPHLHRRFRK